MKNKIIAATFLAALSGPPTALGTELFTPGFIREVVNHPPSADAVKYLMFYYMGAQATITTIQNYQIIQKTVCAADQLPIQDFANAINALSPSGFPETADGGIVYIYSALAAKYPCK